jgi:repressor LexA
MNKKIAATKRQKEILEFIYSYLKSEGYPPTFEDFKSKFDFKSNQAIIDHLESLEKKKLIKREKKSARGINITSAGFKLLNVRSAAFYLGQSSAGSFVASQEMEGEWQELSREVEKFDQNVFIIKVKGDSMIGAGINDGDMLLVQEQKEFSSKDIVVARSPQGTTVKRFISEDKPPYLYLKPENPKYENIHFTDEVQLQGKIIGKITEKRGVEKISQKGFFKNN